jgi:hypothetical protein
MSDILAREVVPPALVYLRGLRGAEPQKWWQPVADHAGYWQGRILAWHVLDGETAALPFHVLAKMFPPPVAPAERKVKL